MGVPLPMSRFTPLAVASLGAFLGMSMVFGASTAGCSSDEEAGLASAADAGTLRRDASPVDPREAGPALDASPGPVPSCEKYCDLVMHNCTGDDAQYDSIEDCRAFCAHLPLAQPTREAEEKAAASVACRQYWADGPARTSPKAYCLAAGPFGGNTCGDRCTAFCNVVLSACSPDGGVTAYASQPECATACADFTYRDRGADGGGEGPNGPSDGDSLNCRLYWLREATKDAEKCTSLNPQSDVCKD